MCLAEPIGCIVGHVAYQIESQVGGHIVGHIVVVGVWWTNIGCVVGV